MKLQNFMVRQSGPDHGWPRPQVRWLKASSSYEFYRKSDSCIRFTENPI